jgi:hypothetical protein
LRSNRDGGADRHFDAALALDFLERRLDGPARRRVEEHLGSPCGACRERIRSLGEMLATMREDRVGEVPASLHQRAVELFAPAAKPSPARGVMDAVARLLFDSATQPLSAAARRSVGSARRLRFQLGSHTMDVECEREGAATMSVRGRISAPDAHLWVVVVEAGAERRSTHPDATGSFVLDTLPHTPIAMRLRSADARYSVPMLEP